MWKGRGWSDAAARQRTLKIPSTPSEAKTWPWWYLDSDVLPLELWENISLLFLSHPVCDSFLQHAPLGNKYHVQSDSGAHIQFSSECLVLFNNRIYRDSVRMDKLSYLQAIQLWMLPHLPKGSEFNTLLSPTPEAVVPVGRTQSCLAQRGKHLLSFPRCSHPKWDKGKLNILWNGKMGTIPGSYNL